MCAVCRELFVACFCCLRCVVLVVMCRLMFAVACCVLSVV